MGRRRVVVVIAMAWMVMIEFSWRLCVCGVSELERIGG